MFEDPGPNLSYVGLDHVDAGELVSALREWSLSVEDDERVGRLLRRLEQCIDVVLVERHPSRAGETRRRSVLPGDLPEAPQEGVREE